MEGRPWINVVNRLLKAKQRPNPKGVGGGLIYWNQGDLAVAAGVRANTLSDIMNAKSEPSLDTLTKLANALEIPVFLMLMSEEDAAIYQRGKEQTRQEDVAASVREEMRGMMMARVDEMLQRMTAEFEERRSQPPADQSVASERPRKKIAR